MKDSRHISLRSNSGYCQKKSISNIQKLRNQIEQLESNMQHLKMNQKDKQKFSGFQSLLFKLKNSFQRLKSYQQELLSLEKCLRIAEENKNSKTDTAYLQINKQIINIDTEHRKLLNQLNPFPSQHALNQQKKQYKYHKVKSQMYGHYVDQFKLEIKKKYQQIRQKLYKNYYNIKYSDIVECDRFIQTQDIMMQCEEYQTIQGSISNQIMNIQQKYMKSKILQSNNKNYLKIKYQKLRSNLNKKIQIEERSQLMKSKIDLQDKFINSQKAQITYELQKIIDYRQNPSRNINKIQQIFLQNAANLQNLNRAIEGIIKKHQIQIFIHKFSNQQTSSTRNQLIDNQFSQSTTNKWKSLIISLNSKSFLDFK